MPTVIDSIQIEIESGSSNASRGLDALAASLDKLKASGKMTTVVKNLQNLSAAVKGFSDASGAVSSLNTLATAIERLKSVGSVASIVNNLTKLPTVLKSIQSVDIDRVAPQLQDIADATRPLAEIKTSGLSSMVNALSKIDKVTNDLNETKIKAFAERVKRLNETLGPLSEKMATIKTGFSAINTGADKASRSVEKFDHGIETSTLNLSSFIDVARASAQSLMGLVQQFVEFLSVAIEWDGIKAQFGNAFGDQADEYYEKITRITDALRINKQAFMENSAMAASMLTGFGVNKEDAREMGLGYTELAYDIWAAYNNVYKTLDGADGAMAAIRSAIAGEVEPIRRAGFTIVESTLQQTAANHGLNISIEKATEAQKSYLRYLTLVDQAQSKGVIGTYAREMSTAEGMMRTFSQQLKTLAQSFGSLFLPILVKVMPYFQAFIELLTDGVRAIAAFFGIKIQDIGNTWNDYSTGVDSAVEGTQGVTGALNDATKAAKELKNASIGIDELNVISPPSASSGGAGSGSGAGGSGGGFDGLDVESLWNESILNDVRDQVDSIKAKFNDWMPVIGGVATALAGLKLTKLLQDVDVAGFKLANLGKVISVAGITLSVGKLVWDFTGAYLEGGSEADLLKAIGTTTIGVALAYWLGGKPGAAFVLAVSGVVTLTRLAVELKEGTVDFGDPETIITALVGGLETVIGSVLTWKTIAPIVKKLWPKIAQAAAPVLAKANPYVWLATAIVAGIAAAISFALVDYDFSEIGYTIGSKLGSAIKGAYNYIKDGIVAAFEWAVDSLDIDDLWDILAVLFVPGEWVRRITPEISKIVDEISIWLEEKIDNLRGNFNELMGGFFEGLFDGLGVDVSWAKNLAEKFDLNFFDAFVGVFKASTNPLSIGRTITQKVVEGMEENGIAKKLGVMWDVAIAFWNKKTPLSTYVPNIGNITTKLSSAWTAAKDWWNGKRSSLSYTPSIGNIADKLKSAWTSAKNWWSDKRSNLSYTPSIGSIYEKVKERWDNARTWWNDKKTAFKTYTPSIGSIADKVKSAWNTAKSWWNKNVGGLSTKLNISVPKITVQWDTASAFGKSFRYPTGFKLVFAADGGMFDAGSLIWAGERGAEIVANAGGGKTGVMNVDQMQEAVYEGVLAAMTAVMGRQSGDGSQSVNVYLDSRQITNSVERRQHEKGASILGNEVFA